ncbi:MAG TPA: DsrE family protein [Sulfurospirillum sp. UBA11407]|nr:MAG TPA: DsrE family protein [Sulfurospirillum sp. UBA11407]
MKNELLIVWSTDNKETVLNLICLYAYNAKMKGWFDEVTILVWGASQQVLCEDFEIKEKVKEMGEAGIKFIACKKCSENMYIEEQLSTCGIEIYYTGEFLSEWLKSGKPVLTF